MLIKTWRSRMLSVMFKCGYDFPKSYSSLAYNSHMKHFTAFWSYYVQRVARELTEIMGDSQECNW